MYKNVKYIYMCVVCTYIELSLNIILNICEQKYLGFVWFKKKETIKNQYLISNKMNIKILYWNTYYFIVIIFKNL